MFDMFEGQEMNAVIATALNHASMAMLFALSHPDEYAAFMHEKQADGLIAVADFDSPVHDTEPIAPDVLRRDLTMAAMLIHGLGHVAQDKAEDVKVSDATKDIDAELSKLLGS